MEQLFLYPLFARNELNIINKQNIRGAKSTLHFPGIIVADCLYDFVCELLARDVNNLFIRLSLVHIICDSVHEMGLPDTDRTVDEKRVIGMTDIRSNP